MAVPANSKQRLSLLQSAVEAPLFRQSKNATGVSATTGDQFRFLSSELTGQAPQLLRIATNSSLVYPFGRRKTKGKERTDLPAYVEEPVNVWAQHLPRLQLSSPGRQQGKSCPTGCFVRARTHKYVFPPAPFRSTESRRLALSYCSRAQGEVPPCASLQTSALSEELETKQHLGYHSFRGLLLDRVHWALSHDTADFWNRGEVRPLRPAALNVAQQLQAILKVYHVEVSSWPKELQLSCPSLGSVLHDKGLCKPCVRLVQVVGCSFVVLGSQAVYLQCTQ